MVFHDYDLKRLTARTGPVRQQAAATLSAVPLTGGDGATIPTLSQVLAEVAGRVPLLIEIKDQDGAMGPQVGPLEAAVAAGLSGYEGPVAVMSFNPHSVAAFAAEAPDTPRGLVTCGYDTADWPLSDDTCRRLRDIPDAEALAVDFISHDHTDLDRPRVRDLASAGTPVLCWTIRSPDAEARARRIARNITFEGYLPEIPA